jgi:superfamily II DNA or RNA helicase
VLAPSSKVRRRDTGEIGIVMAETAAGWRVFVGGEEILLHADDLELVPSGLADHLLAGDLADPEQHALCIRSLALQHAYQYDPFASLNNARIEPQQHQVFVAHRVTHKLRPRMILADEVGLGKTIEAGLIIKELRARGQVKRVLILCPASLTRQWQAELRGKFNEEFEILDGPAAQVFGRGTDNPFAAKDNVICSLPFAASRKRVDQVLEAGWDLVIFDEAHRVRRTKQKETQAYAMADQLKETVDGLLLLTATPIQLSAYELYSLIQLVEPGLFRNEAEFEAARTRGPELTMLRRELDRWDALGDSDRKTVLARHKALLQRLDVTSPAELDDDSRRAHVVDGLVTLHPYADVIIRNRKAELGLAGRREAATVSVSPTPSETDIYHDVKEYLSDIYKRAEKAKNAPLTLLVVTYSKMLTSSAHVVRMSFKNRLAAVHKALRKADRKRKDLILELDDPEEMSSLSDELADIAFEESMLQFEVEQLTQLIDRLASVHDSKAAEAVRLVQRIQQAEPGAKIVLFTQFFGTQDFLKATLEGNGISVALFNGKLNLEQKERAIREFRERATVLISTEAGGEGRNLQFAHHLINFDLPWNPMKVEQRIGRLDRIGQTHPVKIYNLVVEGTIEERVLELLHERIHIFEESVGALDPILGELEKSIEDLMLRSEPNDEDSAFSTFSHDIEKRVREARAVEKRYGDLVLDRASFRRDELARLQSESVLAGQDDVERFCRDAVEYFGGHVAEHEDGGEMVRLAQLPAQRLRLDPRGYRGVFEPAQALRREDLEFFAFGHPLVDTLINVAGGFEGAAVGSRYSSDVPPGTWLELVWQVRSKVGLRRGHLLRHLVNADLQVQVDELRGIPSDRGAVLAVPSWARDAVAASQDRFDQDFASLRAGYLQEFEEVRAQKTKQEHRLYAYQRDRLEGTIRRLSDWIADREAGTPSEKDARILPATRGQLSAAERRLDEVRAQHELRLETIENERSIPDGTLLWVAVVEGT